MEIKNLKLLVLMNNQLILSQIEEVTSELGEPDCRLIEPFVVSTSDNKITIQEGMMVLSPWLMNVTNQNTFMVSSDKILTIVDPNTKLTKKYGEMLDRE
jgi:hypothetical protein